MTYPRINLKTIYVNLGTGLRLLETKTSWPLTANHRSECL